MTVISDYTLMSSFCVRPFTLYREILECTFQGFAYVALLINSHFICWICSFSLFIMKQQQKLSSFLTQKRMAVEPEKHEVELDKDGGEAGEVSLMMSVVQSFNIIVWPGPFFEMTQFKMPCGTYHPLWLISRFNNELVLYTLPQALLPCLPYKEQA